MRTKAEMDSTSNPAVYRKAYKAHVCKAEGLCICCGWHRGDNRRGRRTHGVQKPRHKDHR